MLKLTSNLLLHPDPCSSCSDQINPQSKDIERCPPSQPIYMGHMGLHKTGNLAVLSLQINGVPTTCLPHLAIFSHDPLAHDVVVSQITEMLRSATCNSKPTTANKTAVSCSMSRLGKCQYLSLPDGDMEMTVSVGTGTAALVQWPHNYNELKTAIDGAIKAIKGSIT